MAEEELEVLYWRFDAMHKGLGEWFRLPTSERDAFKRTVRQALAEKEDTYQQLMGQAVGLAETVLQGHRHRLKTLRIIRANASITLADKLLNSPEAQAFLKERGRR